MGNMIIRKGMALTEAQIQEIERAAALTPVPDADAPELSADQLRRMALAARERREAVRKPVVSLRISPETLEKAKATGKGYTGFLSRLLDNAINDPEMVSRSL